MRLVFLALTLTFVAALTPAAQQTRSVERAVEARYHAAHTLKAYFYESYNDGSGGAAAESGTVYFSRPGRMRWDYTSPEKKLFLVDGKQVWFYVPAERTASRAKFKNSSDWRTPLALLVGKAKLSDMCQKLDLVQPDSKFAGNAGFEPAIGDNVLRCIPRGESDHHGNAAQVVYLETNPQAQLVRVVIHQPGNAVTEFRFGDWQENIPLPEDMFHFQPPAGVSVVDQSALANQVY
ncbi:MAG TPA: outer membrane lipoprotein carrier protein LolA [Candidatus Dormibacteraeota bacterium]|nr:outer membrane lipoprotein carrier protein LolA [Candidatus Dormibacteraeota bacterium]